MRFFVYFFVFTTTFTYCEILWFTGLDPTRSTISTLEFDYGADYVYKYVMSEQLNIGCEANDTYEIKDFQFYNSSSHKVIQLNATFEHLATFDLDGSSLFCSCESKKNGKYYSIILQLDSKRPGKLYFTGLSSDRRTIHEHIHSDAYTYAAKVGELLNIGCEADTIIETKRFLFHNKTINSFVHLFHDRFQAIGGYYLRGSQLLCSYENQKRGTRYVIQLKFTVFELTGPPLEQQKPFLSIRDVIVILFSCAFVVLILITVDMRIVVDITTYLLKLCKSAFNVVALPFAQWLRKMRRKRMEAKAASMAEKWAKLVKIEMLAGEDSLIMPVISIEKVRYTEFSDMKAMNLSSEYILPVDTKWELPRENLCFGGVLGEGEFGRVLKAEYIRTPDSRLPGTVAVKMLKEEHTDSDMTALVSEMEIMKIIGKHENVVNLLGCCTQGGPLCVVVEYASNGCLRDYLKKHDPKTCSTAGGDQLSERDLVDFALQVAKGMEFLVSRGCIHRDLAARNVLVSDARALKIADFGLARDVRDSEYYRKRSAGKLPVRWMAPESLHLSYYNEQSDVWSYGVLFWEMLKFGCTPYRELSVHFLYDYLKSGQRLHKPDGCRDTIYALMLQCWTFKPEGRPRFSELVLNLQEILNGLEPLSS